MTKPPLITLSDAAIIKVRSLLNDRPKKAYGIRIALKTKGCSGLSYAISFADEKNAFDEEVVVEDLHILIEPKAIMFILGTQMDFEETQLKSGFIFVNPNEKGRCGCGKSFHV